MALKYLRRLRREQEEAMAYNLRVKVEEEILEAMFPGDEAIKDKIRAQLDRKPLRG